MSQSSQLSDEAPRRSSRKPADKQIPHRHAQLFHSESPTPGNKKLELMEDMYAQSSVTANKRATEDFDHNARKMEKQMKALIEKVHGVLEVEFRHFWYICDRSLSFFYVFTVD